MECVLYRLTRADVSSSIDDPDRLPILLLGEVHRSSDFDDMVQMTPTLRELQYLTSSVEFFPVGGVLCRGVWCRVVLCCVVGSGAVLWCAVLLLCFSIRSLGACQAFCSTGLPFLCLIKQFELTFRCGFWIGVSWRCCDWPYVSR
jgi:hypothetical protein